MTKHSANTPLYDLLIQRIIDYVYQKNNFHQDMALMRSAYVTLLDAMACLARGILIPECRHLLGPIVPGTLVPNGAHVLGTNHVLDPVKAAFDMGTAIRWLDYNDTWLSKEWGHPSDNLGGILAVADIVAQRRLLQKKTPLLLEDVLIAMIQAYEIQGILAIDNAFNAVGIDHVLLVKIATTAVVSKLLGLSRAKALIALSHAWIDGHSLRIYRHAPNVGSRKSWAAGDASARGVFLSYLADKGISPCPTAITEQHWGLQSVLFKGQAITLHQPLDAYVLPKVLFKVAFPAEFHAQTAAEAALILHAQVTLRLSEIERIEIVTQQPAMDIIVKNGPLNNSADRDHCLQYIVAVALLYGEITDASYSDQIASDPRIDALRKKTVVTLDSSFYARYLDLSDRAIPNQVRVFFSDGTATEAVTVLYPLGHPRRREEALPYLKKKFIEAMLLLFPDRSSDNWEQLWISDDLKRSFGSWMRHFLPLNLDK
ncbi:MAG: hypothetical protein RLZ35_1234 [Pseudomonadota bacterium]|jgi:2-methylcitrate dehydratase